MKRLTIAAGVLATLGVTACSHEGPPAGPRPRAPEPSPAHGADAGTSAPRAAHDAGTELPHVLPPPISGGTLAVSPDGAYVVAADSELDTISVLDVATHALLHTVELAGGAEPGRVAIDASGRAHVVLRRAGTIADVDLATGALLDRRAVCAAPRGIAFRPSDETLHVACAEGLLVSLPAAGGAPTRRVHVADDLRDVVVRGESLYVTRFRSAHVLRLDAEGAPIDEHVPSSLDEAPRIPSSRLDEPGDFEPAVAWRAIPSADGVLVLHQRALSGSFAPLEVGYGEPERPEALGCGAGLVHHAMTEIVDGDAPAVRSGVPLGRAVLAVDVALAPDGDRVVLAVPGLSGRGSLRARADVLVYSRTAALAPDDGAGSCVPSEPFVIDGDGGAIAVAFLPDGRLVIQTRAPARVLLGPSEPGATSWSVELPGRDTSDAGHQLFHESTSFGIACASCHPEGGDDGRTWRFSDIGPRRTQTMRGGILDTAPFHWDGDMDTLAELVSDVFVRRMGGRVSSGAVASLARWMDALPALPRPEASDTSAVERGRALFQDATVGCATCHAGDELTNDATVDVGTGRPLQVPTLLGIAYRAPYMHDGCAPTLHDRFGSCGGGDAHGRTGHLTPPQIDDLVAYLRTL